MTVEVYLSRSEIQDCKDHKYTWLGFSLHNQNFETQADINEALRSRYKPNYFMRVTAWTKSGTCEYGVATVYRDDWVAISHELIRRKKISTKLKELK